MTTRWLFGDQLGPHFVDDHRGPLLMVESTGVFRRRRFHRAKAHLVLSAMRHRAAELGDRLTYVQAETYAEVVREIDDDVEVVHPTSYAALGLVERLGCTVLPPRGFATPREDFERWAVGRRGKRLVMEDFYRRARLAHGVLVEDGEPVGGQWNFDHDNRQPPPKGATSLGVTEPWWPTEDDVDAEVRDDLDVFVDLAHHLGVRLRLHVGQPVAELTGAVPHRAQHEVGLGPVEAATAEDRSGLDHQEWSAVVVDEVRSELVAEEPPGGHQPCRPLTYAAWPRCWRQSPMMLTSRWPAVTGGSQRWSTSRSSSAASTVWR